MKKFDMIVIGSGSAMNIVSPMLNHNPNMEVAVIDKDEPGGICLTRGCIPSKLLVYPAELVRKIEHAEELGITAQYEVDFDFIMHRMREEIGEDIENIRKGLSNSENIDYYHDKATFVDDYTLDVGGETIKSDKILLCIGSRPHIPDIEGIDEVDFMTSKEFLKMEEQPDSMCIVGGGYIAAEYGHFMSAMGTNVTIIGRNHQFLPGQEPEVSHVVNKMMSNYLELITGHEVYKLEPNGDSTIVHARNSSSDETITKEVDSLLIATGRVSNADLLDPGKSGIETTDKGWIKVDSKMRTTKEGIWSFGDATGEYLYKHVANSESIVAFYNIMGHEQEMDYHAIPAAVFTYPEVAYVGLTQKESIKKYGKDNIKIGFQKYENTAKGTAMAAKDYFVKVILTKEDDKIVGCHIVGPEASILVQEVINLMYAGDQTPAPINRGMHIHPSLSEVVERAFSGYMDVDRYEHMLKNEGYRN